MDKPQPKRQVGIFDFQPQHREIYFYASEEAVKVLEEFGYIRQWSKEPSIRYVLKVDPRYDFEEVRAYMENYG